MSVNSLKNCDLLETKGKYDSWISVTHFLWLIQWFPCLRLWYICQEEVCWGHGERGTFLLVWNGSTWCLGDIARLQREVQAHLLSWASAWTGAATGTGLGGRPCPWCCGRIRNPFIPHCRPEQPHESSSLLHHSIRSPALSSSHNCY